MVWKLDLHRDSTSAEKPRDFAPKKVTFKNNGGDLPRGPPRVRTSKLVGGHTVGPTKIPRENQRRFPRKDPWAECGVGEVEALQEAKWVF